MRRATPVIFFATIAIVASARAADAYRLTTADFARRDVRLKSADAAGLTVTDAKTNADETLPLASIVELRRASAHAVVDDGWLALRTRDGQRLIFKPTSIRDDSVVCATRDLGERTVAIVDVASIALARLPDEAMPATQQDELRLANGDRVRGIVGAGDARTVTCQTPDGRSVAVDWSNVRTIRFAETPAAPTIAPASFVVALDGGTRVRSTTFATDGSSVTLTPAGGEARVPLAAVAAIEHAAGDATLLAWQTPTSATYEPYFPSASAAAPFVVDAAAAEANNATTAIRVRPKSTLRWSTGVGVRRLRSRCVVQAGKAFADVTVRVLDGERVAFEQKNVRSGMPPIDVDVPLAGGGSVALQVDYGEGFDVQDRVLWLDAALTKSVAK